MDRNNVTEVCAVLFDENCCKASDTFHSIRVGEKGKLCSTSSSLNPFSSCQGPRLDNDVESMIVMPGCKLEVWDDEDGLEDAEDEEQKGFNKGNLKDSKDRYDQEKLVLEARNSPHWIEELNDDFNDMNEDILATGAHAKSGSENHGTKYYRKYLYVLTKLSNK